jgi:hypothetical protein
MAFPIADFRLSGGRLIARMPVLLLTTTGSGPTGGALVVSSQELAQLALPKLFVTAENDGSGVPATIKQMYAVASEPKALQIFPGSMHGTDTFATAQGEELRDLLVDFLDHLR